MNSGSSKTPDLHRLLLNLLDKINLKRSDRYVALSNLSIYYTWKNIKKSYKKNKFKISAPAWNEELELPDTRYSRLFSIYLKKHETVTDNLSIKMCVNKIENRITFKIKTGYYLELLKPETMKLIGSTKIKITENKSGENVPYAEMTEVVLDHCNIVNNDYLQDSRILYTFVPNKLFGQLIDISPKKFIFFKTFNSEFSCIDVWLKILNQ